MLRALTRVFRRRGSPDQLALPLDGGAAPRTADDLLDRLRGHGLARITRCRLTRNRNVMVSFSGGELRVHEAYLSAPEPVLRAIVTFVEGRTRSERRRARDAILGYRVEVAAAPRRAPRARAEDEPLIARLREAHRALNARHFGGRLRPVTIRVSHRMKTRLGHYTAATPGGDPPEIVISRSHLRRHGWEETLHTLLHEMVHQWQDESGFGIDHGARFRAKAREVGITPSARRSLHPTGRRTPEAHTLGRRAARQE